MRRDQFDAGLSLAVERAGGVGRLAELLGVHPTTPHNWLGGRLPLHHAVRLSTHFGIPLHRLRPDVAETPGT